TPLARALADWLVLKPQREDDGNNVYKEDIPPFLEMLPLILPPQGVGPYIIRVGASKAVRDGTVSELNIFGWALLSRETGVPRTKSVESNEGGVS
ncbi:hypothetical protein BKA82DRAFT_4149035, partial [Pisolithus tinctorius]